MKSLAALSLIWISLTIGGCAKMGDFCSIAKPILHSRGDVVSDETKRQEVAHNEKGEKLCGWRAPH
jgi:hypothetical protein